MILDKDSTTGALTISGALDIDSADSLRESLLDGFGDKNQPDVQVDLGAVDSCDAAGLQVLLAAQKSAISTGKILHINSASPSITELATALGFSIGEQSGHSVEGIHDAA